MVPWKNTFEYKLSRLKQDVGINWANLSSINKFSVLGLSQPYSRKNNNTTISLSYDQKRLYIALTKSFLSKKNFFVFFNPNLFLNELSNNSNLKIKNISYLGFKNNWSLVQFAKGNENWGAGSDIEICLNDNSELYDYFSLASNYGNIRVRYIHGFLEKIDTDFNRYLNARGVEWTNKKNIVLALSETIVYSGQNRSLDIGYLNPISSHLELELNNRLNTYGSSNSNAVWQFHLDILIFEKSRLSLNYLIDEFVLDPNIELGKENGIANSMKVTFPFKHSKKNRSGIFITRTFVGTPTFRHKSGYNNFVQNSTPLGWKYGSDGTEITFGFFYFNENNIVAELKFGRVKIGEESIIYRPYDTYNDYVKGDFPSGQFLILNFLRYEIYWKLNSDISIIYRNEFMSHKNRVLSHLNFSFSLDIPLTFF